MRRWTLFVAMVATGCAGSPGMPIDAGGAATTTEHDDDDSDDSDTAPETGNDADGSDDDTGSADDGSGTGSTTDPTSGDPPDSTDTAGDGGPVELYRGPVDGGSVPGWDPENPRPLVMMGRQGDEWVATLARIDPEGALSDNLAEEIIVWGFTTEPPRLYDGPVAGGSLDGWDPSDPIPLVMMGRQGDEWVATLATIQPDGTLGDNLAEQIVVWGWSGVEPGAPMPRYEGPVAGGTLDGWDADNPEPLVMLGTPGLDIWIATLVRIAPDGSLSDNVATTLEIWGW